HYRLGDKYKDEKKYDYAIDEFRKVLATYPDNYKAYMHLAEIRAIQNRPKLEVYNLEKALSYNPGWSKAHKMLAAAYEKDKQDQKAIIALQNYIQLCDPSEQDSIQQKIDQLVKRNTPNQKSADSNSVSDIQKTNNPELDAAFAKVVGYYNANKHDSSLVEIQKVLKMRPDYAGAFYYAGLIRRKNGQNKMAKINFLKAVNYPELGFNAHFYLGKLYGEEKNYSEAIRQLSLYVSKTKYEQGKKEAQDLIQKYRKLGGTVTNVASVKQDTVQAKEELSGQLEIRIDSLLNMLTIDTLTDIGQKLLSGIKAFQAGNYDNSIREFKKIFADNPNGTVALHCLYNTGVNYFKLRLFKESENQFEQVLSRFQNHAAASDALFLKALTYLERKDPSTAEKLFRKFIQENREHKWLGKAYEKLGDAYNDLEMPGKAVDAYSQAIKIGKPIDVVCSSFKLGNMYLQLNNTNRAIESFEKAVQVGEKNNVYMRVPDSYYKIADEYFRMKNYEKALTWYKQVSRKYPSFQETPWAVFQIGCIQKNLKDYKEAISTFKTLIRTYPDDYWAKQAKLKLDDTIWEYDYRSVLN
ncbi:MAG: tetratricopeptide repeat protein, partial [Fibrobacter sp.]|nr:tetratricopeptide repeat protein [Fibrobacter sp.]